MIKGVSSVVEDGQITIDTLEPSSKEDFAELSNLIVEKITQYEVYKLAISYLIVVEGTKLKYHIR